MLQLSPPLPRIVVAHPKWKGPSGSGVANFIIEGSRDDDMVWVIDFCETGEIWCVPNKYVRAPRNITYGRTTEETK
jgi:hypothetical protein